MYWLLLLFIACIIVTAVYVHYSFKTRQEYLQGPQDVKEGVMFDTLVGGIATSKLNTTTPDGKRFITVVRRLKGNNGKVLLLHHCSPFDFQTWFPLIMYYQSLYNLGRKIPTIFIYDLRGHGTAWEPVPNEYNDTNPDNSYWDIAQFGKDARAVYDTYIRTGKIIVVGYGFGANAAMQFALDNENLVEKMYVLCNPMTKAPQLISSEINYLSNWIKGNNPEITYLTLDKEIIRRGMCQWFENSNTETCPYPENGNDVLDTSSTVEHLLGEMMMREASASTQLQINKIVETSTDYTDLLSRHSGSKQFPYSFTQLIAENDYYTNTDNVKVIFNDLITKAYPNSILYIVNGKHGFPMIYPQYIGDLLLGEDMTNDKLTIEKLSQ